jgi:glycosyltransferase involved in cell wall biosynthesis
MQDSIDKPVRIAMVLDTYDDARNGAVISTQRFTKLLRSNGNKVIIVSTGKPVEDKVLLKEFYPPFLFIRNIMKRMKFTFAWPNNEKLIDVIDKVDIVHNHFPFYLGYKAIKIAKQKNKPIVSTFHVQAEQIANNIGIYNKQIIKFIYKIFIHTIYSKSNIVVCPSDFAAQEIKRYGCTTPTVVISNGVISEYRDLHLEKNENYFTLLTVGRNAAEKRQDMLINAVAQSKYKNKIRVQIIGDGPKRKYLEGLANKLLPNQVEFKYLPTEKVIEYYNKADLYVHCAAVEVECMTALEAIACGLPALISDSDLSAAKQFAINKEFVFSDIKNLAEKIDFFYENRDLLADAKTQYLEKSKQFSIEKSYQKLINTYNSLL